MLSLFSQSDLFDAAHNNFRQEVTEQLFEVNRQNVFSGYKASEQLT